MEKQQRLVYVLFGEIFPRSQHYYSITEDKDKVCASKLALSLLWIKKTLCMPGQKERVGCGVKYVQALLGCLKKK